MEEDEFSDLISNGIAKLAEAHMRFARKQRRRGAQGSES